MKKVFNYLLVGAMVVASQSMVFANTGEIKATLISEKANVHKSESVEMTKLTKGMNPILALKTVPAVKSVPAQVLTPEMEAQFKADMMKFEQEKIAEICKVLDLDIKDMKDKSLNEVLEMLTVEQKDKLAESAVIVMAATLTASTEAIAMTEIADGTEITTVKMMKLNKIEK